MIISKKRFMEIFHQQATIIYKNCGKQMSKTQEMAFKRRLENVYNDYTLKGKLKRLCKKFGMKK